VLGLACQIGNLVVFRAQGFPLLASIAGVSVLVLFYLVVVVSRPIIEADRAALGAGAEPGSS
jgi:hypothetical protein